MPDAEELSDFARRAFASKAQSRLADQRDVESGKVTWSEVNRRNCIGGEVAHLYRPQFDFGSGSRLKKKY